MQKRLKQQIEVKIADVDFTSRMSVFATSRYMQNIAADHATLLGFSYYKNGEQPKYYWLVSRVKYIFHEHAKWQDQLTMETYPGGHDKLFAVRLFDIVKEDKLIGHIIADYILMDTEKGRPVRLKGIEAPFDLLDFPYEGEKLDKIGLPETILAEDIRRARYSEIDLNGHMNNAEYLKWVVDMLPLETYGEKEIASLQINYNTSVMFQDTVKLVLGKNQTNEVVVSGTSLDGKTNYFIAQLTLRERKEA